MYNSIIDDTKEFLGIPKAVKDFDPALILHCNTVIAALTQLGVGPEEGFQVIDDTDIWEELIQERNLHNIKSYVYLKINLKFNPPANATLVNSMESQLREIEWRISIEVDK